MPKFEPKQVQRDLENGILWPVYWLYGQERMKSRELLKRIKRAALGEEGASSLGFGEEHLDGSETSASHIVDSAQSLALGGGLRFIVIKEAHAIKESETLAALLTPSDKKENLTSVCVFLSKDLDGRKKFSKTLVEKAAVVPCEEVPEEEREAWIQYLSKRRDLSLAPELIARLRGLEPWGLDIVDQELEKFTIAQGEPEVILGEIGPQKGADAFFEAFFHRDKKNALEIAESFADSPEEALPLLGLFAWNVRYLSMVMADRERGVKTVKLSPFLADRFTRWGKKWNLRDIIRLQNALAELDFGIKQTPRLPLGLWTSLITNFS